MSTSERRGATEKTESPASFARNERTAIPERQEGAAFSDPAPGPRESFLIAYDRLAELASATRRPAFAIAAVDNRSRIASAQLLEAGCAITIGRHTRCRLQLPSGSVSLRHLVALAHDSARVLRIWDLNTGQPFRTEDGKENGAVASEGATYISIGPYAIWFLPCGAGASWPQRALAAWEALPERSFVDRRSPTPLDKRKGVKALPSPASSAYSDVDSARSDRTCVTSYAPPLLLGEDEEPEIAWGTIRLQCGVSKARRRVSAERLEQGLLVGRYERCGLSIGERDVNVSRVHILIVRIGAEVWAIDTGSTNGVRRKGEAIEAVLLADGDRLEFGNHMILDWSKIEHPEA